MRSRKLKLLAILRTRAARCTELREALGIKKNSVRSIISRLRDEGYSILCETTETAGDPRYRLLAEPKLPIG